MTICTPEKFVLLMRRHHLDHLACHLLRGETVGDEIGLVTSGAGMAIRAIEAKVGGDHAHGAEEVIDAEILERAGRDVLKKLSRLSLPVGGVGI